MEMKSNSSKHVGGVKTVSRGTLNASIRRKKCKKKKKNNNLGVHLKKLEEKEQNKPKEDL